MRMFEYLLASLNSHNAGDASRVQYASTKEGEIVDGKIDID